MNKDINKLVAERLKSLLKSTPGLDTQKKLERRSGVGQSTIGRIIRAETDPQISTLADIAGAFGKSVVYLLSDSNEQRSEALGVAEPPHEYTFRQGEMSSSKKVSRRQITLIKSLVSGFESGDLDDRDADAVQSFLAGRMSAR